MSDEMVRIPKSLADALRSWSGAEPSQSILAIEVDQWMQAQSEDDFYSAPENGPGYSLTGKERGILKNALMKSSTIKEAAPQPAQGAAPASGGETPLERMEAVERNAQFWFKAGHKNPDRDKALMEVSQTVFAYKNAAYAFARELAAANAAREGAMEEAALICETKAAVFYQERNFLAQSASVECADAIRSAAKRRSGG